MTTTETGSLYKSDMYSVYMCSTCHTVLSDGKALCGHNHDLAVIAYLRVTSAVNKSDTLAFGIHSNLEGCAFNRLTCNGCGTLIGFNLYSATRPYTHLRGLYCLLKQQLLCYLLGSKTIVDATQLHIDFTHFTDGIRELKEGILDLNSRVNMLFHIMEEKLAKKST